jgi:hypothetical protein
MSLPLLKYLMSNANAEYIKISTNSVITDIFVIDISLIKKLAIRSIIKKNKRIKTHCFSSSKR